MPLPTIPEQLAAIIERCKKDASNLVGEYLLAQNLTGGGGENPLSLKVQEAIKWTNEVQALCEEYQERGSVLYPFLFARVDKLLQDYQEIGPGRWEAPCVEMLNQNDDQAFAKKLYWREHQIKNALTVAGQLHNLRESLDIELNKSGVKVPPRTR